MKKGKHPVLYTLKVVFKNDTFITQSAKNLGSVLMNASRENHSAWTGKKVVVESNERIEKINAFF